MNNQIAEKAWEKIKNEIDDIDPPDEVFIAIIQSAIEEATELERRSRYKWMRVAEREAKTSDAYGESRTAQFYRHEYADHLPATDPTEHRDDTKRLASELVNKGRTDALDKLMAFARAVEPYLADAAYTNKFGAKSNELYQACERIRPLIWAAESGEHAAAAAMKARGE